MADSSVSIVLDEPVGTVSPMIYGHFMEHLGGCIDNGVWVGTDSAIPNRNGLRSDVMDALKAIRPPVVRWPGGCFADDYHWQDGIGPTLSRPRRVNMHWGSCIETNGFGTHEFMAMVRGLNAEPYIAGNLGSGTPREMRDWVEYCNFPGGSTLSDWRRENGEPEPFAVRYWGVGNENWGCGGSFTPEDYATEYRRYSTYLKNWGGTKLSLIACGPNGNDTEWTRRFFTKLKKDFWDIAPIAGFAAHHYCHSESTATEFEEVHWYQLLQSAAKMEPLVLGQRALMDQFDPERKIGLIVDEWGAWHKPTPGTNPAFLWQQSTIRDAVVASVTFDTFNRNAGVVAMANIAQTINVLQSLLLTEEDRMVRTPTYHVFDLYKDHHGGESLRVVTGSKSLEHRLPQLSASASNNQGIVTLTVTNQSASEASEVEIRLLGGSFTEVVEVRGMDGSSDIRACNTFDAPDRVILDSFIVPRIDDSNRFSYRVPAATILRFTIRL